MNTKRKGSRNEHRSMALLEAAGYQCTRAAASLGAWDIIGVGPVDVVLCQVKTNRWPSRAEMSRLLDFPAPEGVNKLVHRWRDRQRKPDVMQLFREPISKRGWAWDPGPKHRGGVNADQGRSK